MYCFQEQNEKFEFPEIFPTEKLEKQDKKEEDQRVQMGRDAIVEKHKDWDRAGVPGWFSL